jgi:hypothetical protein
MRTFHDPLRKKFVLEQSPISYHIPDGLIYISGSFGKDTGVLWQDAMTEVCITFF